jgi:hypothetical protein
MPDFGKIKKVNIREIWQHEAHNFTPWLAENIEKLGESVGMDLELIEQEASVGNYSLDILAKDLSTGHNIIIENQFGDTDHDHLGKMLTYAAGFDASKVIWISENVRDEHRQTIEWLNQRTDTDTQFLQLKLKFLELTNPNPPTISSPSFFLTNGVNPKKKVSAKIHPPKVKPIENISNS